MLGDASIQPHSSSFCASKSSNVDAQCSTASSCDASKNRPLPSKDQSRIVVLNFSGEAIRWYPLLHIGHVYEIVVHNSDDVNMFKNQVTQPQLRKVLQEAHTSLVVGFTQNMEIHEMTCDNSSLPEQSADNDSSGASLSDVLSELKRSGHMSKMMSVEDAAKVQ